MEWLGTLFQGLIVGLIARAVMPGEQKLGLIMTTVLGVAGAMGATFLGQAVGWYQPGQGARWIAGIVGSFVLLAIYGFIQKSKSSSATDGSGPAA